MLRGVHKFLVANLGKIVESRHSRESGNDAVSRFLQKNFYAPGCVGVERPRLFYSAK